MGTEERRARGPRKRLEEGWLQEGRGAVVLSLLAFTPNSVALALTKSPSDLLIVTEECLETWEGVFVVTAWE